MWKKLLNGFYTFGDFVLGDDGEIGTNRVFRDIGELFQAIDKTLDKYDVHPFEKYTGDIYSFLRSFQQVNRPEQGRGANEDNNILEFEGEIFFTPKGDA